MMSADAHSVMTRAKALYESRLRQELETRAHGRFVAIEPESGEYFLGDTFDDAVNAALDSHEDRLTYTIRIGHAAALHLGGCTK
jgi:hypothetical protein